MKKPKLPIDPQTVNRKLHNNHILNHHILKGRDLKGRLLILARWVGLGILTGLVVGAAGSILYHGVSIGASFRAGHPWILFLLPLAGLFIVFMYRALGVHKDSGTNLVIRSIQEGEHLPLKMTPLIMISTILTHLFGGSAGRESAGLQVGGSLGYNLGRLFRLDENDLRIITMCGMSAAFASLFGTPMTAAFFAMEIESVGVMYYASLVPCVLSALVASSMAAKLGITPEVFAVRIVPTFSLNTALLTAALAVLCAFLSVFFCAFLHESGWLYQRLIKNPYIRVAVGGALVILVTLLTGSQIYNGASIPLIEMSLKGEAPYGAFALKMLLTALTLGAGYKGGEIVPSLCVGATFGCMAARLGGFDPALASAIGMGALFCGVTNCPISSLLICFELFGYAGMPYYLLTIALSYTFSGYHSLYSSQKIIYSKFHNTYVNRETK